MLRLVLVVSVVSSVLGSSELEEQQVTVDGPNPEKDKDAAQKQLEEAQTNLLETTQQVDQIEDAGKEQKQQHQQKQQAQQNSSSYQSYQKYLKEYVPQGDQKYMKKYLKAGSYNWTKIMKQYAGNQAEAGAQSQSSYSDYVDLYSQMAGSGPSSGHDWQGKQSSQTEGFSNAMNTTFSKYIPQNYQSYASKPVDARVSSGGGGTGESGGWKNQNQGSNYQGYMKQYSGSGGYKQYFQKYTGGATQDDKADSSSDSDNKDDSSSDSAMTLLEAPSTQSHKSGESKTDSGYQKYMNQYAGGSEASYEKYMKQYAGGSGGGSQGGSEGSYEKYMKQYAGGQGGSSGADYQKYMKQYAGSQGGSSGGDYQKYMKQYAGGQGGSSGDYQKYMKQYAGGQGSSSGADYQKYMKQYAGGQGSSSGADYQKYMKQYAGGQGSSSGADYQKYMKQYAGGSAINLDEKSSDSKKGDSASDSGTELFDYQKYMNFAHKNFTKMNQDESHAVHSAKEATTKKQLDEWKEAQLNQLNEFVPEAYSKYADKNIEKAYKQRLQEIDNTTDTEFMLSAYAEDDKRALADAADHATGLETFLVDTPSSMSPKEEKNQVEVEHLRGLSVAGVEKVEAIGESLRRAAHDSAAIELAAEAPFKSVKAEFSKRHNDISSSINLIQESGAVDQSKLAHAEDEAGKLRADELHALSDAYRQARDEANQADRTTQKQVRGQARQVRDNSDHMARLSEAHQDLANKLQNRVEAAADDAQEQGDLLTRRSEDALDQHLSKAQDLVRKQDSTAMETLNDLRQATTSKSEAKARILSDKSHATFMAQRVEENSGSNPIPLSMLPLVAGALALAVLYAKSRNGRSVELPMNTLG